MSGQELTDRPVPIRAFTFRACPAMPSIIRAGSRKAAFNRPRRHCPLISALGEALSWTGSTTAKSRRVMFTYTPSYTGRLRFAAWNALNHSASFNAARQFGRWKLSFAAAADLSNLSEFLFSPTVFASVAAVPATFSDLAAAILTGNVTNTQLASLLTGAPLVESPARNLFFGERMFTSAAQTSLAYAPSPRVSLRLDGSVNRSQHLSDNSSGLTQNSYLIPRTSSASAGLDVSYSRSSQTQLGVSVNSSRVASTLQDAYSTTVTASLGPKDGEALVSTTQRRTGQDARRFEAPSPRIQHCILW